MNVIFQSQIAALYLVNLSQTQHQFEKFIL